jgi:hypothetical protein
MLLLRDQEIWSWNPGTRSSWFPWVPLCKCSVICIWNYTASLPSTIRVFTIHFPLIIDATWPELLIVLLNNHKQILFFIIVLVYFYFVSSSSSSSSSSASSLYFSRSPHSKAFHCTVIRDPMPSRPCNRSDSWTFPQGPPLTVFVCGVQLLHVLRP